MPLAQSTLQVKDIISGTLLSTRAWPTVPPSPVTTLATSGDAPASFSIFAIYKEVIEVYSDTITTTVQPVRRAGAIFCIMIVIRNSHEQSSTLFGSRCARYMFLFWKMGGLEELSQSRAVTTTTQVNITTTIRIAIVPRFAIVQEYLVVGTEIITDCSAREIWGTCHHVSY